MKSKLVLLANERHKKIILHVPVSDIPLSICDCLPRSLYIGQSFPISIVHLVLFCCCLSFDGVLSCVECLPSFCSGISWGMFSICRMMGFYIGLGIEFSLMCREFIGLNRLFAINSINFTKTIDPLNFLAIQLILHNSRVTYFYSNLAQQYINFIITCYLNQAFLGLFQKNENMLNIWWWRWCQVQAKNFRCADFKIIGKKINGNIRKFSEIMQTLQNWERLNWPK